MHRVEFEFGREALREFNIDGPDEALDAAGSLWCYATQDWLTLRTPTNDLTPSRWPIAPEWVQVQRARIGMGATGLERLYAASRRASLRAILPALTGYLATAAWHLGTSDIEDTLAALPPFLRDYELISRTSFADRVAKRRLEATFS